MDMEKIKGWGLGNLIALIVLLVCILLGIFLDKPLTNEHVFLLIGALALARLL